MNETIKNCLIVGGLIGGLIGGLPLLVIGLTKYLEWLMVISK